LHLLSDFEFLGGAAFGFLTFGGGPALGFDGVSDLIKTDEGERVAVGIPKAAEDGSPNWRSVIAGSTGIIWERRLCLQSVLEAPEPRIGKKVDAALTPFAKLCEHVFGNEGDMGCAPDLLELFGVWAGDAEREIGCAIGRTDDDPGLPGLAGLRAPVKDDLEAEQVQIEGKALVEIPHIDHHRLQAQEGLLALQVAVCGACHAGPGAIHGRII
jgi:hypothetical protein